ncbi:unnamed protein product [Strongylus vulgaris]|uniref:EGF-like domain-containing protein n=1 Tax=Strongylus vulgaris TaxID=40348 RepID=A0A3P7JH65_STRVU|nr:unnamed protein product [Strongylus vulgaris]
MQTPRYFLYCRCDFGWKGLFCSECVPLAGCQNGYCRTAHQCECFSNWGGVLCNIDLDYCSNHKDVCKNGGICLTDDSTLYKCNCTAEYYGRNCERRKELDCSMLDCGAGKCVIIETPHCECPSGYVGAHCEYFESERIHRTIQENRDSKPSFRIDVLLISIAILILAVCLAVISVLIRFICEKLEFIQKEGQSIPFYSAHWVAAEVHLRGRHSRSSSPPPTYDTGQSRSPCKSWLKSNTDLLEEVTV